MCDACTKKTDAELQAEAQEKALEWARVYAWDWFVYHAGQRTSMFNYGIAAATILAAGYGTAIDKHAAVSAVMGLTGAVVCLSFLLVDIRNGFLVGRGEEMLRAVEATLFPQVSVGSGTFPKPDGILTVIKQKERKDGFWKTVLKGKHRFHLRSVQVVFMVAFVIGAWAAYERTKLPQEADEVAKATTTLATNVSSMATNVAALSAGLDKMTSAIEADARAHDAVPKAQAAIPRSPARSQGAK